MLYCKIVHHHDSNHAPLAGQCLPGDAAALVTEQNPKVSSNPHCVPFPSLHTVALQGNASEAMQLYLQLSKLGPAAGTTSSAALAKLARAAAAADDADAIQVLQKQLPGESYCFKLFGATVFWSNVFVSTCLFQLVVGDWAWLLQARYVHVQQTPSSFWA